MRTEERENIFMLPNVIKCNTKAIKKMKNKRNNTTMNDGEAMKRTSIIV